MTRDHNLQKKIEILAEMEESLGHEYQFADEGELQYELGEALVYMEKIIATLKYVQTIQD